MKDIVFIVGSIRKGSFNAQLAKIAEKALAGRANITYISPSDFPFMNQDIEVPAPKEVAEARSRVIASDGIWIFTPEYNHNIPGLLKNLLDWLSRPLDLKNLGKGSAVKGKKVTVSGIGGNGRTSDVRAALVAMLNFIGMNVIGETGNGFSLPRESFATGQWTPEKEVIGAIGRQAEEFLSKI